MTISVTGAEGPTVPGELPGPEQEADAIGNRGDEPTTGFRI